MRLDHTSTWVILTLASSSSLVEALAEPSLALQRRAPVPAPPLPPPPPPPPAPPAPPALPILEFDCTKFPNVCATQCYGAYCVRNTDKLTYAKIDVADKRVRRKQAGCIASGGNRCSTRKGHAAGFSCDEYPYASTVPRGGLTAERLNKCVPASENSSQGGTIQAFIASHCNNNACDFQIKMTGGGNLCDKPGDNNACDAERANIQQPSIPQGAPTDDDTADDGTEDNDFKRRTTDLIVRRYITSSGREIELRGEDNVGRSIFQVIPRNATLHEEQAENHIFSQGFDNDDYSYMFDNLEVREETIVIAI